MRFFYTRRKDPVKRERLKTGQRRGEEMTDRAKSVGRLQGQSRAGSAGLRGEKGRKPDTATACMRGWWQEEKEVLVQ